MASPESVINGRFQFLERPAALPGKCAVCGAVDKPVVDFGLTVDYYGAVIFCTDCIREAYGVVENNVGPAQGTSLPYAPPIDIEAVNEYLGRTLDATNRLLTLLPDRYFDFSDLDEEPEAESKSNDGVISDAPRPNDAQFEFAFGEGPNDSASISGSGPFNL